MLLKTIALTSLALSTAAIAQPQIQRAPPPVVQNPNVPRPPVGHPETRPGNPPPVMFTDLAFSVWTGDDDLRSSSVVWAHVVFGDGTKVSCNLRPEHDTWGNNSAHNAPPCVLSTPRRLGELKKAKIDLTYDGDPVAAMGEGGGEWDGGAFDTYDNWNVNQVRIFAENLSEHQKACLLDASGKPLVRMKHTNTVFPLSDAWSNC